MSVAKNQRSPKRQLGQFLTPQPLAQQLVDTLNLRVNDRVLEPSMGDGAFIIPLIEKFMTLYTGSVKERLALIL